MIDKAIIEEMLYTNPLLLLAIKDKQVIQELNDLVPYSTAFEIECDYSKTYNVNNFKGIPDIMDVHNDSGEQRYRIPNGLVGIICVYNICTQLRTNSLLNPLSGIHYHVDCTDCFDEINTLIYRSKTNTEYILSELDKWLIGETVGGKTEVFTTEDNTRFLGSWFKLNDLKTIEFRLGEMTFDYKVILKRIIHCNQIVKHFKDKISEARKIVYVEPDKGKLFRYQRSVFSNTKGLQQQYEKYNTILQEGQQPEDKSLEEFRTVTKNRNHIIKPNSL